MENEVTHFSILNSLETVLFSAKRVTSDLHFATAYIFSISIMSIQHETFALVFENCPVLFVYISFIAKSVFISSCD